MQYKVSCCVQVLPWNPLVITQSACVSKDIASLREHLPYETVQAALVSESLLCNRSCISPLRNSFLLLLEHGIFPLTFLTPHSLRWNTASISNPPPVDWMNGFHSIPFLSCMLSLLDSAATAQLHCSTVPMFQYHSTFLSWFLIGQLSVTISLIRWLSFSIISHGPCAALV